MQDPLDWSSAVAQQVCTLVRDERVLARFRAQCVAFWDEKKRDEEQLAAWEQRRKEHCQRGLQTLAEFKARSEETERLGNDREAIERTRPTEDMNKTWVFDYYHDLLTPGDLARLGSPTNGSMLITFCVWVPPDLSLSASPKLTVPPLFGRFTGHLHSPDFGRTIEPGRASWAEKYASLAAIHDARFPDREPIDELHHINCGRLTEELRRRERAALRRIVSELPNVAKANVLAWVADVEADLAEHVKPPGGGQGGTASRNGEELPDAVAHKGASSMFVGEMQWLKSVAATVHQLTPDVPTTDRVRKMIRAWAERTVRQEGYDVDQWRGRLRQEHPDWAEDRIQTEFHAGTSSLAENGHVVWKLTTQAGINLDQQYAALAAIHDTCCDCGRWFDPWEGPDWTNPYRDDATDEHWQNYITSLAYHHLRKDVRTLTDEDRAGVERILANVAADLTQHCGGETTPPGGGDGSGTAIAVTGAEHWLAATKATDLANRLTDVGRDWSSFWRGFCEKHHVMSRPGTTKQGSPTEWRREVEVGSLVRAIQQHADEFEKATPEVEKRRTAIHEKLRAEFGIDPELQKRLLEPD